MLILTDDAPDWELQTMDQRLTACVVTLYVNGFMTLTERNKVYGRLNKLRAQAKQHAASRESATKEGI